jgi:hypothetical protein
VFSPPGLLVFLFELFPNVYANFMVIFGRPPFIWRTGIYFPDRK